uniref:Claudin n=1 Tax=Myripristis murdjan TaxID=586833 RepID=A0A668ADH5_9TELE
MYMEIGCFVVSVCGWILVCSTMPTEIWTWSEVDSIVLTASNYFSNLWKDCISDSTGVSDCKGIPSMLALNWDIHMCRALIITSIILGFFRSILVLVGMKCTKIGGSEIANARVPLAEFQDPNFKAQKFEIGVGVFTGWGGSTLLLEVLFAVALQGRKAVSQGNIVIVFQFCKIIPVFIIITIFPQNDAKTHRMYFFFKEKGAPWLPVS